jgi:hypothetical protein
MEILIGLAIATVAVIGWLYGNLFVCVFLTLPVAALCVLSTTSNGPDASSWTVGCIVTLIIIWAPFVIRPRY